MRFLLVCEGNSDIPLGLHMQRVLSGLGFPHSDFDVSTRGRLLADKIGFGLQLSQDYDLIVLHRDADRAGPDVRYEEISGAVESVGPIAPWVGIVPVRTTESWLLLDESAIRHAVGNPNGRTPLHLPSPIEAEGVADPKSVLRSAMLAAGDVQGRRRRVLIRRLPALRDRLLENLPVGGPLEQVPSWARFRDDTVATLQELRG